MHGPVEQAGFRGVLFVGGQCEVLFEEVWSDDANHGAVWEAFEHFGAEGLFQWELVVHFRWYAGDQASFIGEAGVGDDESLKGAATDLLEDGIGPVRGSIEVSAVFAAPVLQDVARGLGGGGSVVGMKAKEDLDELVVGALLTSEACLRGFFCIAMLEVGGGASEGGGDFVVEFVGKGQACNGGHIAKDSEGGVFAGSANGLESEDTGDEGECLHE